MATPTLQQLIASDITRDQLEDFCRATARSTAVAGEPPLMLSRVLGKYMMYSLARDSSITPHLAMNGIWEPWVTMAIARHLKPGMRCLDVGACYGYYTLLMADLVTSSGYVEAYEPLCEQWELTRHNVSLNGFDNWAEVMWSGVGTADSVVLEVPKKDDHSGLFNAGGSSPARRRCRDTFLAPLEAPLGRYDFVKIDVEGAEEDVWHALPKSEGHAMTVCMEFTPSRHDDPKSFLDLIVSQGFSIGTVGHDGYPRACSIDEALIPDTGDFRMLWLERHE